MKKKPVKIGPAFLGLGMFRVEPGTVDSLASEIDVEFSAVVVLGGKCCGVRGAGIWMKGNVVRLLDYSE